jgi:fucose permease
VRGKVLLAVLLSYAGFVLVGLTSGSTGVLLLAQIKDYGVDRAVIGITFFVSSAGFFLASLNTGPLLHRFGFRTTMVAGSTGFVLAGLYLATRPTFWVFLAVQLVTGYAVGLFESVLNAYLAELPDATVLINRLHAFFGVGALGGPALAAWILGFGSWRTVWLVLALVCVPLGAGFAVFYPGVRVAESAGPAPEPDEEPTGLANTDRAVSGRQSADHAAVKGGLVGAALRQRGVLLGSAMLVVYVGVELSVGSWAFSYLVQGRSLTQSLAGWLVSGYWLGLTLGRFLISPIATRLGWTAIGMMYGCLTGVLVCSTLVWLVPGPALAGVALGLLGFFLGPIFPTTMALAPQMVGARLQSTAIGIMNAASTIGASALPWLAGAIGQSAGVWTLLPYAMALAALQFVVWRPLAMWIRRANGAEAS